MANEALFVQGGSYDAAELRRLISGFFSAPTPGGIIDGLVVTAGVGSSVSISAGHAYVLDGNGGGYMGTSTTTESLSLTGWSGTNRTDRVYARIMDPGSGSTAGEMEFNKAQGSTSIPSLAIPLADVTVTSSGVTISNAPRVSANINGAASTFATVAAVNALTARVSTLEAAPSGSRIGTLTNAKLTDTLGNQITALNGSRGIMTVTAVTVGTGLELVTVDGFINYTLGSSYPGNGGIILAGLPQPANNFIMRGFVIGQGFMSPSGPFDYAGPIIIGTAEGVGGFRLSGLSFIPAESVYPDLIGTKSYAPNAGVNIQIRVNFTYPAVAGSYTI